MKENPRWEAVMAMTAAVIIMLSSSSQGAFTARTKWFYLYFREWSYHSFGDYLMNPVE